MAVSLAPVLKYVVGIDIAKDTFVACFGRADTQQTLQFSQQVTFDNSPTGFAALLTWTRRQQTSPAAPLGFVVEATGVYYEQLAYFLSDHEVTLSVLLPNKVKHFAQSTPQKSKTDQLDARLLTRLGLERALPAWQAPTPALRRLRALTRERQRLSRQRVQLQNQRHAYQHSYRPEARTLARLTAHQQLLDEQIEAVDQDLAALLPTTPELARKLAHLTSIPGIGQLTALTIVAETQGFALIENERQLASYAGLDVVQHQSGSSVLRAGRISRRGNTHLRTALYLPAVSSLRCHAPQRAFYERLRQRQPSGKPGVIAVMRKLLLLSYALWKTDRPYDPHYHPAHGPKNEVAPAHEGAEATQDGPTSPPLGTTKIKKTAPTLAFLTQ